MRSTISNLRLVCKKLKAASTSRERACAVAEALPLLEKALATLAEYESAKKPIPLDADVVRLLASLGKGVKTLGREYYVCDTKEFDQAARALIERYVIEKVEM